MKFVRLYRKGNLICTIPVDKVYPAIVGTQKYESYNTGVAVDIESSYLQNRFGLRNLCFRLAFVNSYGQWRLSDTMERLMGSRTGVTFTSMEIA